MIHDTKLHKENMETGKMHTIAKWFQKFQPNENESSADALKIRTEFICVMYCIQYNLQFGQMNSLPAILSLTCNDSTAASQIKCGKTKARLMVNKIIMGPFSREHIAIYLRESKCSIIIDETTDIATEKCLVIIARNFNSKQNKIIDSFFGLLHLYESDSDTI